MRRQFSVPRLVHSDTRPLHKRPDSPLEMDLAKESDVRGVVGSLCGPDSSAFLSLNGCMVFSNDDLSDDEVNERIAEIILERLDHGLAYVARWNDEPLAVWGYTNPTAFVCEAFLYRTPAWPKVADDVRQHHREWVFPMTTTNAHMLSYLVPAGQEVGDPWVESIGAPPVYELPHGSNGEMFRLYVWADPDNVLIPSSA